jgi:uncharacterized protein
VADLERDFAGSHELGAEDLRSFVSARSVEEAKRAATAQAPAAPLGTNLPGGIKGLISGLADYRVIADTGMNSFSEKGPLTEAELSRLTKFLTKCRGGKAMNVEEVDGFFAALIAGPEVVPPSEYLPEVFGGDMSKAFAGPDEANQILGLLMRHWNVIAATLHEGDVYLPILMLDDDGVCEGTDWARGFMRGVDIRKAEWAELFTDEKYGGCMVPVMMLYHEHDEDPELRPGLISPEQREEVFVQMAAGIVRAYRYFRADPQPAPEAETHVRPDKIGRNEPCPCGSGKKYKRCCAGLIVN